MPIHPHAGSTVTTHGYYTGLTGPEGALFVDFMPAFPGPVRFHTHRTLTLLGVSQYRSTVLYPTPFVQALILHPCGPGQCRIRWVTTMEAHWDLYNSLRRSLGYLIRSRAVTAGMPSFPSGTFSQQYLDHNAPGQVGAPPLELVKHAPGTLDARMKWGRTEARSQISRTAT